MVHGTVRRIIANEILGVYQSTKKRKKIGTRELEFSDVLRNLFVVSWISNGDFSWFPCGTFYFSFDHVFYLMKLDLIKLSLFFCDTHNFLLIFSMISIFFFQVLFLFCIFGYLVILIFYKWIAISVTSKGVSFVRLS